MFPDDLMEWHKQAHDLYPNHVFCLRGSQLDLVTTNRTKIQSIPMLPVDIPEGWGSVSFRVRNVSLETLAAHVRQMKLHPDLWFSDDVMFGNFFWKMNLTVRTLPVCMMAKSGMAHATDQMSLMLGRGGDLQGTNERMTNAIVILKGMDECHLRGFGNKYKEFNQLKTPDRISMSVIPIDLTPWPAPISPSTSTALVIFGFKRPAYMKRVLHSVVANKGFYKPEDTYVFIDGIINPYSRQARASCPDDVEECVRLTRAILGPNVRIFRAACNHGVAVMQYVGLWTVFKKYRYKSATILEDDMVLGKNYLASVQAMDVLMSKVRSISCSQGGYRKFNGDVNDIAILDARKSHVHYWGWYTTRQKVNLMFREYEHAINSLFYGVDYVIRKQFIEDRMIQWFQDRGLSPDHLSQDWIRDACFRRAGMSFKFVCAARRAAPIGIQGLHCNPALFAKMQLDDSTADIDKNTIDINNIRVVPDGVLSMGSGLPKWFTERIRSLPTIMSPTMDIIIDTKARLTKNHLPAMKKIVISTTDKGATFQYRGQMSGQIKLIDQTLLEKLTLVCSVLTLPTITRTLPLCLPTVKSIAAAPPKTTEPKYVKRTQPIICRRRIVNR